MVGEGVINNENSPHQELIVFNVSDWAVDEIAQLCRDTATFASTKGITDVFQNIKENGEFLNTFKNNEK